MPSDVKLQFAGASDFAVRRPNALAVDYESDLGAKRLWYNGKTLTIFDAPSMTYAVPPCHRYRAHDPRSDLYLGWRRGIA
jgi:hypothetical protein